ncbi:MAG: hypothetical protein ACI9EW_002513 [Cellvibrionaceae bacterium]|jgi:hypothetical protein
MNRPKLAQWKTLLKRTLLDLGKFLKVESHEIQLPDGAIIPDWSYPIGPDAALVAMSINILYAEERATG